MHENVQCKIQTEALVLQKTPLTFIVQIFQATMMPAFKLWSKLWSNGIYTVLTEMLCMLGLAQPAHTSTVASHINDKS
jgi:hypothetical protein